LHINITYFLLNFCAGVAEVIARENQRDEALVQQMRAPRLTDVALPLLDPKKVDEKTIVLQRNAYLSAHRAQFRQLTAQAWASHDLSKKKKTDPSIVTPNAVAAAGEAVATPPTTQNDAPTPAIDAVAATGEAAAKPTTATAALLSADRPAETYEVDADTIVIGPSHDSKDANPRKRKQQSYPLLAWPASGSGGNGSDDDEDFLFPFVFFFVSFVQVLTRVLYRQASKRKSLSSFLDQKPQP
jgi:hypothetical protein